MPPPKPTAKPSNPAGRSALPTRERIRAIAEDFYVLRGHDGFSFGDIAAEIGTTRANIHHHFGSKRQLMAELIDKFTADAEERIALHWTRGDARFAERLDAQIEDLRHFYNRFNKQTGDRHVWSPLSRLRLDLPALGELATSALERIDHAYDVSLRRAVKQAIAAGELVDATPVDDVARVLRMTLLSCAPITQDTGNFREIERLLSTLGRMIVAAWATPSGKRVRRRAGAKPLTARGLRERLTYK